HGQRDHRQGRELESDEPAAEVVRRRDHRRAGDGREEERGLDPCRRSGPGGPEEQGERGEPSRGGERLEERTGLADAHEAVADRGAVRRGQRERRVPGEAHGGELPLVGRAEAQDDGGPHGEDEGEDADDEGRCAASWPHRIEGEDEDGADGRCEDGTGDEEIDLRGRGGGHHRVTTADSAGSVTDRTRTGATPRRRTARASTPPGTISARVSSSPFVTTGSSAVSVRSSSPGDAPVGASGTWTCPSPSHTSRATRRA